MSVFIVHLAKTLYRHIFTAIYRFLKIYSSRHNNIMSFKIRYYNANLYQRRYRIPMFIGTPCIKKSLTKTILKFPLNSHIYWDTLYKKIINQDYLKISIKFPYLLGHRGMHPNQSYSRLNTKWRICFQRNF